MRRGHTLITLAALFAATAFFTVAPAALADGASPTDICQQVQNGQISPNDPIVQGYCGPIVVVLPPATPAPCTSTTSTSSPGMPATCSPPCTETTAGAGNGSGNGTTPPSTCTTPPATTPPATTPPSTPTSPPAGSTAPTLIAAVAGAQHTVAVPHAAAVQGAQHTVKAPARAAIAPIATVKASGTLPFTGAQLGLFAVVGLALLATGLLLRSTGRSSQRP